MARRVEYRRSARADFAAIARYIAQESGSRSTAQHFIERLRRQCRKLASLPGTLGTARPELGPDLRSFPFRGYVIFFRYADDRLEIVNIIEGHRDMARHVSREEL